jgi:cell shape-determining protein MreC
MLEETITVTGTQLGWFSFLALVVFHILAWIIPFRNLRREKKLQEKREILRDIQLERDKLCSEMINYKKETGYAFRQTDVQKFAELAHEEIALLEDIEETT